MELMQTGRRRWGRPTTRPVAHQGPARLCIQDQRERSRPGARNVRDSEAYSRRGPGTSPGRPSAVLPLQVRLTGAVWIFQRHWIAFEGSGFLDLHVEPTSITQSTRLPDSNLASDDQCAAIVVSG